MTFTFENLQNLQTEYLSNQNFQKQLPTQNDGMAMQMAFQSIFGRADNQLIQETIDFMQEQNLFPEFQKTLYRFVSKI